MGELLQPMSKRTVSSRQLLTRAQILVYTLRLTEKKMKFISIPFVLVLATSISDCEFSANRRKKTQKYFLEDIKQIFAKKLKFIQNRALSQTFHYELSSIFVFPLAYSGIHILRAYYTAHRNKYTNIKY